MRILFASLMLATAATPALAQNVVGGPVLPDGTLLDVVATGDITRVPDVATLRAGVVTQAATASEASAQNASQMARVIAALRRPGAGGAPLCGGVPAARVGGGAVPPRPRLSAFPGSSRNRGEGLALELRECQAVTRVELAHAPCEC